MTEWNFGLLRARTGNETMRIAGECGVSAPLYPHLVFQGEVSCLFSDTNIGKSILAVQIGCYIASHGSKVAYYDFELSERQFYMRYSDHGVPYQFPESFIRLDIDPTNATATTNMMASIEESAIGLAADVLIIDNLSWLCLDSEDGATANALMKEIKGMQKRHGWTIIVVAHTPKRNEGQPLSVNDLAGSRQLANFFDSIFALGRCFVNPSIRYLKQVKVRSEELYYTEARVVSFVIKKENSMLRFVKDGIHTESEMLRSHEDMESDRLCERIVQMRQSGKDPKEISLETGETVSRIQKILYKKKPHPSPRDK